MGESNSRSVAEGSRASTKGGLATLLRVPRVGQLGLKREVVKGHG